jgi:tRNA(Arg) A34 adenosine deaminase TadA
MDTRAVSVPSSTASEMPCIQSNPELTVSTISTADQAASLVLSLAMQAANQNTFAVGGALVRNDTGEVVQAMHNNVLKHLTDGDVFTWDPTAHGERQLVYWYYANRVGLELPEPSSMTVVTSLDPCVMCTGALLTAGFNVGVVAIDDYAGINYDSKFEFAALAPNLRALAKRKFGYYAAGTASIDPPLFTREYSGSASVALCGTRVCATNLMGCGALFADSSNVVRNISSSDAGLAPGLGLLDPAALPDQSPIKLRYREVYPRAFRLRAPDARFPGAEIIAELARVAEAGKANGGSGDAVALLDPFGNLVLCMAGREQIAPVYTAFMEVTQSYANLRWELMNDAQSRDSTKHHLTTPKYGTFVFWRAPDPHDPAGVMTLGAYGSTMEGAIPQTFPCNFQYVNPPQGGLLDLAQVVAHLPPFYTELVQLAIAPSPGVPQAYVENQASVSVQPFRLDRAQAARNNRIARHRHVYRQKALLSHE